MQILKLFSLSLFFFFIYNVFHGSDNSNLYLNQHKNKKVEEELFVEIVLVVVIFVHHHNPFIVLTCYERLEE